MYVSTEIEVLTYMVKLKTKVYMVKLKLLVLKKNVYDFEITQQ